MGKQVTVVKRVDIPLPNNRLYEVGATVILSEDHFDSLPAEYVAVALSGITTVPDPLRPGNGVSQKRLAWIDGSPVPVTLGAGATYIEWVGADFVFGDDYWEPGVVGPLDMTVEVGTPFNLRYPVDAANSSYYLQASITYIGDPVDIGKFVNVVLFGNNAAANMLMRVDDVGHAFAYITAIDQVFLGDANDQISIHLVRDNSFSDATAYASLYVIEL
jgi:hypothetical protein